MKIILTTMLMAFCFSVSNAQLSLIRDFNAADSFTPNSANTFVYASNDGYLAKIGAKVFLRYDTLISSTRYSMLTLMDNYGNNLGLITVPARDESITPTFYDFKLLTNGKMAFVVNDNDNLFKIYISDGLATAQLIVSSTEYISGIESIGSGLYFTRAKESVAGSELMKIDIANSNTVSNVKDFGDFYYISDISKTDESTLVFMASDAADSDKYKLYASDGTAGGTSILKDIYSGNGVSQQTVMTQVGNKVFFFYKESGVDCCNYLYVTDGTSIGTTNLKEFNTVFFVDYERGRRAISYGSKFYFMAVDNGANSNNDRVLWVSDGTTVGTIPLHLSSDYRKPAYLTPFNGKLYFTAFSQNSYNYQLYSTDGTALGTTYVSTTFDGNTIRPSEIVTDGTYLYMAADSYAEGAELFRYDGSNAACMISEGASGSTGADPKSLIVNGTDLYITAYRAAEGREAFTATNFTATSSAVLSPVAGSKLFSLYPNPAQSSVDVITKEQIQYITVLSNLGKELETIENSSFNIANYPAGFYYIKVVFENQQSDVQKLIVTK